MASDGADDATLIDGLRRHMKTQPDAVAYRTGPDVLSFADVEAMTNRIANGLVAMGVRPGERVSCLTKRHAECLLLTVAAYKAGAVCMPVNWRLSAPEVEFIVGHGQARFMMVDQAYLGMFTPGPEAIAAPDIAQVVCTDAAVGAAPSLAQWASAFSDQFEPVQAHPDDAALQLYSSGTTGLPKGVVLSHRGLLSTARVVAGVWGIDETSVLGNPLPTFHIAGMTMLLQTLYSGAQTTAYSDFDPAVFIDGIRRHGITHSFLVPAMLLFMLDSPAGPGGDYSSLKLIAYGGSPISERVLQDAMRVFACDFIQVYGLTETSGPVTKLAARDHRTDGTSTEILRSAGQPVGGAALRIVDPVTHEDLPEGETGEVWAQTIRNLKEYWRDAVATAHAFPLGRDDNGGWFRTGDGGYLKDGYLYINDRIKDMIISGGENIYPAEIENVLMSHPAVADGAVIGVPDPTWGEAVKACVVLKPGAGVTDAEIIDYVRGRLARYKCPKSVDFVDALPRNPTGKVLKRILREPYWKDQARAVH